MENISKKPSIRELLEKGLQEIGQKWGHYCRYNNEVTKELSQAGFIINLRGIEHFIKTPETRHGLFVKKTKARQPHQIILANKRLFLPGNHLRAAKKANTAKVSRNYDKPLDEAVLETWGNINTGEIYVGTDWQGHNHTDRSYRIFTATDIVRAHILRKELRKKGQKAKIRPYSGNLISRGATQINVHNIPSLSSSKTYIIHVRHIAAYKENLSKEIIQASYDLCEYPPHNCGKPEWHNVKDSREVLSAVSGKRTGEEKYLDLHFILGFKVAATHLRRKGFKVIDPFPEVDKPRERFFNQLDYVIVEDRQDGQLNRSHLNFVGTEIAMNWYQGSLNFRRQRKT